MPNPYPHRDAAYLVVLLDRLYAATYKHVPADIAEDVVDAIERASLDRDDALEDAARERSGYGLPVCL